MSPSGCSLADAGSSGRSAGATGWATTVSSSAAACAGLRGAAAAGEENRCAREGGGGDSDGHCQNVTDALLPPEQVVPLPEGEHDIV